MEEKDEWRRRIYNNRDLLKEGEKKKKAKQEGERLLGDKRSWEFTSLDEESFLPGM